MEEKKKYPIPGFSNYTITEDGVVYNSSRKIPLRSYKINGFMGFGLTPDRAMTSSKFRNVYTHRLVAMTFIKNKNPERNTQVRHIDGNIENNHYSNLEWCSHQDILNARKERMEANV